MSLRVQCPSCGRGLIVSDSAGGEPVSCPRCLAEIAAPSGWGEAVQADRPERPSGESCPRCGRTVEPIWLTCPWCEEPLGRGYRSRYGRPDLDVRRDRKAASVVVIILAVLGGVGVAILGFQAFGVAAEMHSFGPMLYLAVPLLFLAGLSTLIVFVRSGGNPGAGGVGRVVVGTLAMAGGILTVTTCAGLALFVFFLVVCLSGNGAKL